MSKQGVMCVIMAMCSFVDETGTLRYAGDEVKVSNKFLEAQNELCEKHDLPQHVVLQYIEEEEGDLVKEIDEIAKTKAEKAEAAAKVKAEKAEAAAKAKAEKTEVTEVTEAEKTEVTEDL